MIWFIFFACGPNATDITKNLSSDNPVVREDSAKIARNVTPSSELVSALILMLDDPSLKAQKNAIETLVELEAEEAVPRLCELLLDPTISDPILHSTLDALGRLKSKEAVPSLIDFLSKNPNEPELDAIWALGFIGDNRAMDILSELRMHSDAYVSHNATVALRELRP